MLRPETFEFIGMRNFTVLKSQFSTIVVLLARTDEVLVMCSQSLKRKRITASKAGPD